MSRVLIWSMIFLFAVQGTNAQNLNVTDKAYRDSLKTELFIAENDTSLVNLLNALAESYWVSKYDSGNFYAKNGLLIARKINYNIGEINSLLTLSLVSSVIGDVVRGYEYSSMAINLAQELNNPQLLVKAYTAYGEVLASTEKYREAIEAIKKAVEIKGNDAFHLANNYAQLSDWYTKLDIQEPSDAFAKKAFETLEGEQINAPYPLRIIANMHRRLGDQQTALDFYQQSISASNVNRDDVSLTLAYLDLSRLYTQSSDPDSAFHYANLALKSAEASRSLIYIIEASNYLSELYTPIDKEKALKYAMKSNSAKDSLKFIIQEQSIKSFDDFDLKLRELEIEQAKNDLNAKIKQNTFLGSIIVLFVIAVALYLNNRVKQKGKKKIEKAYEELKSTQQRLIHSEKMASLGELTAGIAHEIQNPLNFVNNFSELNNEMLEEIEMAIASGDKEEITELVDNLKGNERRIVYHGKRAEEIVKTMLLHSRTGLSEKEDTDINSLADECLSLSYHGIRAKDNEFKSAFQLVSDPMLPKVNVVRQDIGRVLLNLISNAFYAVTEKAAASENGYVPTVEVITEKITGGITITVKDNGPGIPEDIKDKIFQPFFTTKETGTGKGLGLSLSYDIITKGHGGSIEVKSSPEQGTEFVISLVSKE